jgi:hypothetical protein
MRTRIALAGILIAGCSSLAVAQSSTATSGATKPMTTAPASTLPNGQPKWQAPPAARSGEKGLPVGEGAVNGDPVTIKRQN